MMLTNEEMIRDPCTVLIVCRNLCKNIKTPTGMGMGMAYVKQNQENEIEVARNYLLLGWELTIVVISDDRQYRENVRE